MATPEMLAELRECASLHVAQGVRNMLLAVDDVVALLDRPEKLEGVERVREAAKRMRNARTDLSAMYVPHWRKRNEHQLDV